MNPSYLTPISLIFSRIFAVRCGVSMHEISIFFRGDLVQSSAMSEVYFPPLPVPSSEEFFKVKTCRFFSMAVCFPPSRLRDVCGAQGMYVRSLKEKSTVSEYKYIFPRVNHLFEMAWLLGMFPVSIAFKINVFLFNVAQFYITHKFWIGLTQV